MIVFDTIISCEEGSELSFLKQFPFDRVPVGVVIIEKHHVEEIMKLMERRGFRYDGQIGYRWAHVNVESLVFVNETYVNAIQEELESYHF